MENKIDWKGKLTSRKFWMAVVGLVSGILVALNMDEQTVAQVTGIIMAAASVVAYILGEGWADAASANAATYMVKEQSKPPEDRTEDNGK